MGSGMSWLNWLSFSGIFFSRSIFRLQRGMYKWDATREEEVWRAESKNGVIRSGSRENIADRENHERNLGEW